MDLVDLYWAAVGAVEATVVDCVGGERAVMGESRFHAGSARAPHARSSSLAHGGTGVPKRSLALGDQTSSSLRPTSSAASSARASASATLIIFPAPVESICQITHGCTSGVTNVHCHGSMSGPDSLGFDAPADACPGRRGHQRPGLPAGWWIELRRRGLWPAQVPAVVLAEALTGDHRRLVHADRLPRACQIRDVTEPCARVAVPAYCHRPRRSDLRRQRR